MLQGDRSDAFDALSHFVRVLMQQGRPQLDADADDDKYLPVRRFRINVEDSLDDGLGRVVFEPNDGSLWLRLGRRSAPKWAGADVSDPGVTLVELLAYVADRLSSFQDDVADEADPTQRRRRALATAALVTLLMAAGTRHRRRRP
jgi:hypothetical protein